MICCTQTKPEIGKVRKEITRILNFCKTSRLRFEPSLGNTLKPQKFNFQSFESTVFLLQSIFTYQYIYFSSPQFLCCMDSFGAALSTTSLPLVNTVAVRCNGI